MEYMCLFGYLLAFVFGYGYITAQNKLDDYRTDSYVLNKLREKYGQIWNDLEND